jgi:hypothetical protein
VHFLIADAIPCAVERESRPRNFLEAEHIAIKLFRPREVAHRNGDVMKGLEFQHTFYFLLSTFHFSLPASRGRAHHIVECATADDTALKFIAVRPFPMRLEADCSSITVSRKGRKLSAPVNRHLTERTPRRPMAAHVTILRVHVRDS